jgi:hypothetical protein
VIVPTHFHALLFHADFQAQALAHVVTAFRKFTGRRLADFCAQRLPASFQNVLVARAGSDRDWRLWQPTRHPVQMETEPLWQAKSDSLHHNPVRKGLVQKATHWRFSSASSWASGGKLPMTYGSARLSGERSERVAGRETCGRAKRARSQAEAAGSETCAERGVKPPPVGISSLPGPQ